MQNKFYLEDQYRERFYQLPKVFFTNPNYKKLSNDAKIAYAILRDRLDLSIKNKWIDEQNAIYFIYTNENLMSILGLGKNKIIKIKKELESVDLLEQKRQGLNKPNLLYLKKPNVTDEDIYKIHESENSDKDSNDTEVYKTNFQKFTKQTSRSLQNKLPEVYKTNSNDTEFNDTDFNDTKFSDTTTTNKKQSGSSNNIIQWLKTIQCELNIEMTAKYEKDLSRLLKKFNDDVIAYAIEHTSHYAKNPKPFILKVLQKWEENNIKTVKQAKEFKVNKNVINFSREKTPEWLKNRDKQSENEKEMTKEEQAKFEKERNEFRKQLKEYWGEDRND
ncbi:DnaD domain protein [Staphylococcus haemolyticus]|uniref:DnaD domain protein n=1 Tax=Staphylococcus haemolyticus TaxID=1283 RepID=UPI001F0A7D2F|nr:DnaD domain protein [Staphylococcus haemolyticus]MCH4446433.1 replication initiator protein A [Staphylococcus haemolyticus]